MIAAVSRLFTVVGKIVLFFLKKNAKPKTPKEKYKNDIKKMDQNLADGDGMGITRGFDEMRREYLAGDGDPRGSGSKDSPER